MKHTHASSLIEQAVAEISGVEAGELNDKLLNATQPLVIRGLVADWPAVQQATPAKLEDYLETFDAGHVVTAMSAPPEAQGRLFYNEDLTGFNFEYQRLSLRDALQEVRHNAEMTDSPTLYVGSTNIDHWLPGFRDDNDLPIAHLEPLASIWIGNRSRVSAHYDFPSNIACVVAGQRQVILFPPEQLANLYVGPLDVTPAGQPISLVDFHKPDFDRFPRFRNALAAAQATTLNPGDAIVIPSMWWHHLEALDAINVLVNYWWRSSPSFLGAPLNVLQHALLGLRDLPETQRQQWRALFDHYVFAPDPANFEHIPEHARGVLNPVDAELAQRIRQMLREKIR